MSQDEKCCFSDWIEWTENEERVRCAEPKHRPVSGYDHKRLQNRKTYSDFDYSN